MKKSVIIPGLIAVIVIGLISVVMGRVSVNSNNPDCKAPAAPYVNWNGCMLSPATHPTKLIRVNLHGANLSNTKFIFYPNNPLHIMYSTLESANFRHARLNTVIIGGEYIGGLINARPVSAERANFSDSIFSNVEIYHSNFQKAKFVRAKISYREVRNFYFSNFDEADFRYATIENIMFRAIYATKADFRNANLRNVTIVGQGCFFQHTNFNNAKFNSANISNLTINGAASLGCGGGLKLHDASFAKAILNKSYIGFVDAVRLKFNNAALNNVHITYSEIQDSSFESAVIKSNTKFEFSNLANANFTSSVIDNTTFNQVSAQNIKFEKAKLNGVAFTGHSRYGYEGANFNDSTIFNSKFSHLRLNHASFKNVEFVETHINNSVLNNADFDGAKMHKLYFRGSELTGTKNLLYNKSLDPDTHIDFSGATFNGKVCAEGSINQCK